MNPDWLDWPESSFDDPDCHCSSLDNHTLCPIHGLKPWGGQLAHKQTKPDQYIMNKPDKPDQPLKPVEAERLKPVDHRPVRRQSGWLLDRAIRKLVKMLDETNDPQIAVQIAEKLNILMELRDKQRAERRNRKPKAQSLLGYTDEKKAAEGRERTRQIYERLGED